LGRSSDTPHAAIGAYFRDMGRRDALSRDEEVAIARRIEAGQQALRDALFLTPMFAGQIRQWGSELRRGHLRLRDFADLSASHLMAARPRWTQAP
jgi:RNA polymerase primary sigma factor